MEALVLERKDEISLRPFVIEEKLGPRDVRIALRTVGVCGSDVHYYTHGAIGPFVVKEPMILGHEAAGEIVEVGSEVRELQVGDRVCMEPGIPDPASRATRLGKYNLDPAVRFWATPPVHGMLRPSVVHPADFTFKLPDNVSYAEGAMVEPLAVGMHAATKLQIQPGDLAVVIGAGPIGMVTVLAALAAGCSRVIVSDIHEPKLDLARQARAGAGGQCPEPEAHGRGQARERRLGRGPRVRVLGLRARDAEMFDLVCPGGKVVAGRHPARALPVRRQQGAGEGGEGRERLPLRPRLPARGRDAGLGQDRREAADHRPLRLRGQRGSLRFRQGDAARLGQGADRDAALNRHKSPPLRL